MTTTMHRLQCIMMCQSLKLYLDKTDKTTFKHLDINLSVVNSKYKLYNVFVKLPLHYDA